MFRLVLCLLALGTGALLIVPAVVGVASSASAVGNAGAAGATCTVSDGGAASPATVGGVDLTAAQMHNAQVIVAVVKARGLPQQGAQVALMTAIQESALIVVDHGDAAGPDSRGLFQQRNSWGPLSVRMDAARWTGLFLDRLVNVAGWPTMDPPEVAHLVQRNANAEDYRKWIPFSQALGGALFANDPSKVTCDGGTLMPGAPPSARAAVALNAAAAELGKPYCFDGGNSRSPTHGAGGDGCPTGRWVSTAGVRPVRLGAGQRRPPALLRRPVPPRPQGAGRAGAPGRSRLPGQLGRRHPPRRHRLVDRRRDGHRLGPDRRGTGLQRPVHVRKWSGINEPEVMPYAVRLAG